MRGTRPLCETGIPNQLPFDEPTPDGCQQRSPPSKPPEVRHRIPNKLCNLRAAATTSNPAEPRYRPTSAADADAFAPVFLRQNFHFATLAPFVAFRPSTLTATAKPTPILGAAFPVSLSASGVPPLCSESDPSDDEGGVRGPNDDTGVELALALAHMAGGVCVEP